MKVTYTPVTLELVASSGGKHDRFVAACESSGGARLHVWLHDNLTPEDGRPIVYKNSIECDWKKPGFFNTRKLDGTKGQGKAVMEHLLAGAKLRVGDAAAAHCKRKAEERREQEAREHLKRIKAEAPAMWDLVVEMVRGDGTAESLQRSLDMANAILRRVEAA